MDKDVEFMSHGIEEYSIAAVAEPVSADFSRDCTLVRTGVASARIHLVAPYVGCPGNRDTVGYSSRLLFSPVPCIPKRVASRICENGSPHV